MASSASCCCSSTPVSSLLPSPPHQQHPRLFFLSAPSSRLRSPIPASPDPPLQDWSAGDDRYGFEIQLSKTGKRNRRLVRARVRVDAVWATLTDYQGLADFIPGLSDCRLLDQGHRFARLYQLCSGPLLWSHSSNTSCHGVLVRLCSPHGQVGEQDLALGFKFNAKGTIDCYEGETEVLPATGARRREIAFKMIDGDFKLFEGKWSVQEVDGSIVEGGEISEDQGFQTTLSYLVELEPKLWVPVRLLEGRICSEIKNNLVSIREQAQRIQRLQDEG